MKQRIIGAIIIAVICIPMLLVGGIIFKVAMSIIACLAIKEILDIKGIKNYPLPVTALVFISSLAFMHGGLAIKLVSLILFLYFTLSVLYYENKKFTPKESFMLLSFSLFIGLVFNTLMNLYLDNPLYFLLLVLVCVFTDVFAYTTGVAIGKHKVTKISPKKSMEGFIGGLVMGTVLTSTYYMIFIGFAPIHKVILIILLLCISCEIGDLFYSALKRQVHIKDFSNLIPGHGGILDRIDSLTIVTLVYIAISGVI